MMDVDCFRSCCFVLLLFFVSKHVQKAKRVSLRLLLFFSIKMWDIMYGSINHQIYLKFKGSISDEASSLDWNVHPNHPVPRCAFLFEIHHHFPWMVSWTLNLGFVRMDVHGVFRPWMKRHPHMPTYYISIPRTQLTSIFEDQRLKTRTRPFPRKTRVILGWWNQPTYFHGRPSVLRCP